jgi:hypothetical protein
MVKDPLPTKGGKEFSSRKATTRRTRKSPERLERVLDDVPSSINTKNILLIDSIIKNKLKDIKRPLIELEKKENRYCLILENTPYENERIVAQRELDNLKKIRLSIETGADLTVYIVRSRTLLKKYGDLRPRSRSFGSSALSQKGDPVSADSVRETASIVRDFLRIAKDYIDLDSLEDLSQKCDGCGMCGAGPEAFYIIEEEITVCECGNQIETLNSSASYKDSERVNCSTRCRYTPRQYLEDAIKKYECKQFDVTTETLKIIEDDMKSHGIKKEDITKDTIYSILGRKQLSDNYTDINGIYCYFTGEKPPDISHLQSEILEMSDQFEIAYKAVSSRTNALSVLWKLYMFLQILDHPCKRDEFFCLKTQNKRDEHYQIWGKCIEYLMVNFPDAKTPSGKQRWRPMKKNTNWKRS